MSKEVMMELLSSEYGWTPQQIRKQRSQDIKNYIKIIGIKRNIQKIDLMKNKYGR